ncbi:hypothetical protein [Paenibacillus periandrae]|uniref:hypothetical protein n=1 Tax=Paenibacillus periandrae TaxID=1761741 RepID=UPI001F08EC59|nr:hypothetical protein [Paenibacillus periandrae]
MNDRIKSLLVLVGLGLAISYWMVWEVHTNQHLTTSAFLLLAKPASPAVQLPNDGSSYTFHLKHHNFVQE